MKTNLLLLLCATIGCVALMSCGIEATSGTTPAIAVENLPEEVLFFPETEYNQLDSALGMDGKLKLSVALNNPYHLAKEGNEYLYFYVNLTAAAFIPQQEPLPLNLALVIDRSGSMLESNKMQDVIKSAKLIIDMLGPKDRVSIVSYSDNVTVDVASGPIRDKEKIKKKLDQIQANGMTNLEGGMLEGFKQVAETYQKNYINRVILLSDGQANIGETSPAKLSKTVQKWYEERNISITSFGVGLDYNEDLMTSIANAGKGNYYYIAQGQSAGSLFEKELNGLLATLAKNLELKVTFPSEYFQFVEMYGFSPEVSGNTLTIKLHDLLSAESKTLLVKCYRLKTPAQPLQFKAEVSYTQTFGNLATGNIKVGTTLTPTTDSTLVASHYQKTVYQTLLLVTANKNYELATQLVDEGKYDQGKNYLTINSKLFSRNGFYVQDTTAKMLQVQNQNYESTLDSVELLDASEFKHMQKSNKLNVYEQKRVGKK